MENMENVNYYEQNLVYVVGFVVFFVVLNTLWIVLKCCCNGKRKTQSIYKNSKKIDTVDMSELCKKFSKLSLDP